MCNWEKGANVLEKLGSHLRLEINSGCRMWSWDRQAVLTFVLDTCGLGVASRGRCLASEDVCTPTPPRLFTCRLWELPFLGLLPGDSCFEGSCFSSSDFSFIHQISSHRCLSWAALIGHEPNFGPETSHHVLGNHTQGVPSLQLPVFITNQQFTSLNSDESV